MDLVELGGVRAYKIVKTTGTTSKNADKGPLTVVLMHGYGAPGDDLVSLADVIDAPAGTTFLFPEAPAITADVALMSVLGDARAWWAIDVGRFQRAMMTGKVDQLIKEIPEGMPAARKSIVSLLDAVESEMKTPSSRVVLGGFSQGSMLALDVALRDARPFAGLVILSGTLLASDEWLPKMKDRKGLPVFQSHGTDDPILPCAIANQLRHALDDAGVTVTFRSFMGGHGIPPEVMRDLGLWLRSLA